MPNYLEKPPSPTVSNSASSTRWSYIHKNDFSNSNGSESSTGSRDMLQEVLVGTWSRCCESESRGRFC
jgi:hypothetical protein